MCVCVCGLPKIIRTGMVENARKTECFFLIPNEKRLQNLCGTKAFLFRQTATIVLSRTTEKVKNLSRSLIIFG